MQLHEWRWEKLRAGDYKDTTKKVCLKCVKYLYFTR